MSIKCGPKDTVPLEVIPAGITAREFMKLKMQSTDKEDYDDPFYIMDIKRLVDLHRLWTETFPMIKPFYAVKCNNNPAVLSTLAYLGTGFDCASKNEIREILDLGVSSSNIVFANPCKQTSHIQYASKKNVSLMTFDNVMELYKVAANYNRARLVVRIRADDPHAICQLGSKYGCTVSEACQMLNVAKSLGLNVVGVSFHVGSGCQTPDAYRIALEMSYEVFQYADTIGYRLTLLDIGGGFPGTDEELPLFQEVAATVNANIEKLFSNRNDIEIIAEPGRFFATSCFSLAVQVTSKRVCDSNSDVDFMYYVNDGVYGSFNCLMYDHAVVKPCILKDISSAESVYSCSIWGPTCDSLDKICEAELPALSIGDWIAFDNMGAYTLSAHSDFNGFKSPKVFYYIKEEDRCEFEEAHIGLITGRILPVTESPIYTTKAISFQDNNSCLSLNIVAAELQVAC